MRYRLPAAVVLFAVAVFVGPLHVLAQPEPKREPVRGEGTIKGPAMGGLQVVGNGGDQIVLRLDPKIKPTNPQSIEFVGKADESWLKPGMLVRFTSRFDRRGKPTDPIDQLDVITLRDGMQIGMVADTGPAKLGAGLFQDLKPEKPQKKPAQPEPLNALVVGQLTDIRNGKLTINAAGKVVKAELAEKVRISVNLGDLSYIRSGDKIDYQGWTYAGMKQQVVADRVTITAQETLVAEKKKGPGENAKSKEKEKEKEKDKTEEKEKS